MGTIDLAKVEQLLARLNKEQRAVANIGPGAAAVVGVPGSGKTTALVARVARMVRDGLHPQYILGMTFTRAAASELSSRLQKMGIVGCRMGTIHSLSLEILQSDAPRLLRGLQLDESSYKVDMEINKALTDSRRDKVINRNDKVDLDGLKRFFCFAKAGGPAPVQGNPFGMNNLGEDHIAKIAEGFYHPTGGLAVDQLLHIYYAVENRRMSQSLYDFDDMQLWAWQVLVSNPDVLQRWRNRWSVIMVDEAQDSSPVQWDMARLIAGGASRILPEKTPEDPPVPPALTALGDASQAIYAWRAAVPSWFVDFATEEDVGMYTLPVNYRSTPEICWLTSRVVDGKAWHLGGEVISSQEDQVGVTRTSLRKVVALRQCNNMYHEASLALDRALELAGPDNEWNRVVIMSRLSMFLHVAEVECIRRKIPYEKRASGTFFDSTEVQDLLSYLRVAGGWDPTDRWVRRCIRAPFRYIGKPALEWAASNKGQVSDGKFITALAQSPMLSPRQMRSVTSLQDVLETLSGMVERGDSPRSLIEHVIEETMYLDWLKEKSGTTTLDASKQAAIDHLLWLASAHEKVGDLISHIDQVAAGVKVGRTKQKEAKPQQRLILSTIHRMKGLEADHVLVADMADGRFPWNMGFSEDEELRLLYVCVSRARFTVDVSWSASPSVFVRLLSDCFDRITDTSNDSEKEQSKIDDAETFDRITDTQDD